MKIFIIITLFSLSVLALEINPELVLKGSKTEKKDASAGANGTVFVNIVNTEKATADLHYRFGDTENRINVAQLKLMIPKTDIVAGRQLMSWGSGYNFNPTDIFNAKPIGASFDPGYSKRGRDAINTTFYFNETFMIDIIYAFKYSSSNKYDESTTITETGKDDYGARIKFNLLDFDIALSKVKIGKRTYYDGLIVDDDDHISGLSIKGSLPLIDWGIWFEGVRYYEKVKYEFTTGLEIINGDFTTLLEYYYNGFGKSKEADYNVLMLYKGQSLGKNYFAPSVSYVLNEKLTLRAFAFYNINDSSIVGGGLIDYFYNDYIELALSPSYIFGMNDSEYGMLKTEYGDYGVQGIVKINF